MPICENCGIGIGKILDYEAHFRACVGDIRSAISVTVPSVTVYQCQSCKHIFSISVSSSFTPCPKCGGNWLVSPPQPEGSFFGHNAAFMG